MLHVSSDSSSIVDREDNFSLKLSYFSVRRDTVKDSITLTKLCPPLLYYCSKEIDERELQLTVYFVKALIIIRMMYFELIYMREASSNTYWVYQNLRLLQLTGK